MNQNKPIIVVVVAIICLTLLELAALYNDINGALFTIVIAMIAGLAGYIIPSPVTVK